MHVCADKAEWEHIHFFHGNGNLGIILGLVARNKGLALGSKGLKILPNLYLHRTCSLLHMGYPMQSQNYRRVHKLTHIWLPVYIQGQCRAICGEDGFLTPPSGQTRLKIRAGGL
ncbi:hypothetical protein B0H14DRAFT_2602426 [Mycena olivaceomarginata]|nr:hypothetical protein B0H14DRAFT_2602426 [Mycena olivaceomarginata]